MSPASTRDSGSALPTFHSGSNSTCHYICPNGVFLYFISFIFPTGVSLTLHVSAYFSARLPMSSGLFISHPVKDGSCHQKAYFVLLPLVVLSPPSFMCFLLALVAHSSLLAFAFYRPFWDGQRSVLQSCLHYVPLQSSLYATTGPGAVICDTFSQ